MPDKFSPGMNPNDAPAPRWRDRTVDPDTGNDESKFREEVRDILGFHWDARNDAIYAELRRLKAQDERVKTLSESVDSHTLRMTRGVR